jgi:pyruvate-ferredoxin/flavodoxin oxidoreductase
MAINKPKLQAMDGMTAAAQAAYALSDCCVIYPITPASHMAETVESWSVSGKKNLFDATVDVKEMQSEKGVAGALHGALAGGALATTMTASQGLMLMIPNLYKLSGELLPGVLHVTCRSLSAHALSIFGDHQDLMAVRATGVAMLGSANVQECMDLSLVAHLSAIQGSLPFVHFFDGFRTSDEIETIEPVDPEDMRGLVDTEALLKFRRAAMEPERPLVRGTAQNPDIYFQNREAANRYYDALPGIVQANMDKVAKLTGRQYRLFDYVGAPDAERVVVAMASACDVVEEVVNHLVAQDEKVGVVKVRLYRPFSAAAFVAAIPETAKVVCALDRTKEPGSQGEPLLLDTALALMDAGRTTRVIGGRYGLSSKEFDPAQVKAVFDNMAADEPKRRFTVGIDDDVTHTSLAVGPALDTLPGDPYQAVFYGFGSDGTVGATKAAARILGDTAGLYAQDYSWFDSKKSGGLTICYQRFGKQPIRSPYLVSNADYVACHKDIYVKRGYDMTARLAQGGTFVLNCAWSDEELARELPADMKRALAEKGAKLYAIDASGLAVASGLGHHINMVMVTVFLKLSRLGDFDALLGSLEAQVKTMYASKGADVVARNLDAISKAAGLLREVAVPDAWKSVGDEAPEPVPGDAYAKEVFWPMERLEGDALPVSKMDPAGFAPLGTTALEKRTVAFAVPEWDVDKCIQCYQCSFVCSHAAIRPFLATDEELAYAPETYRTKPATLPQAKGMHYRVQVYPEDCVGCGSCAHNCPAPGKALVMKPLETQLDEQKVNLAFAQANVSVKDELTDTNSVPGTQLREPLLQFGANCAGCGETPYVKLLTQLFGDRLIVANATGCSSIWGAYMPAIPYAKNRRGHGPAWGNSLFEDNGEYGYGIAKGVRIRRERLERLVDAALADAETPAGLADLLGDWKRRKDDADASYELGEAIKAGLAAAGVRKASAGGTGTLAEMAECAELFAKKSVWAVGGDGWAYDIGFGGLDEVLASGEDINVLVLDTEGYSNTGGEMSKATQLGSVSGFSADGKKTPKKDLGRMMVQYGYVYVAHVCLGANMTQVIRAMHEAESYPGPSIVIALCPCISWGLKDGMSTVITAQKEAVSTGYWPLWRFDPRRADAGLDPLQVDSKLPDTDALASFLDGQDRYASLKDRKPTLSATLQSELAKDCARGYGELERMVDVYKPE